MSEQYVCDQDREERIDRICAAAEAAGYFLYFWPHEKGCLAASGDWDVLMNVFPNPEEQLTVEGLKELECRSAVADSEEQAILKAFMKWHTHKTEENFRRSQALPIL